MKRTIHRRAAFLRRSSCAIALLFIAFGNSAHADGRNGYVWKNVQVSGANAWVTGIIAHPGQKGLYYMRTDVGGCYRWDIKHQTWIPLNDFIPFSKRHYYGGESIAIDPSNPKLLYYAGGTWTYINGTIFKSTDQGATWKKLAIDIPMGGNEGLRWAGERLAVSPAHGNVILFGSRTKGLWRSTDAGTTWANVPGIPVAANNFGVQTVGFDKSSPGKVYAGVAGKGVFQSSDDGATWTLIGGDLSPRHVVVAVDGTLWYAHGSGISKYAAGKWTDYTVGGKAVYDGLTVNPTNANDILVSQGEAMNSKIWRTLDGGATWTRKLFSYKSTVGWWRVGKSSMVISNLLFDPCDPHRVWADNSLTTDIDADLVHFDYVDAGHEEDCLLCLATPPSGIELFSGIMDVDGFAHDNGLDAYPTKTLGGALMGYTLSIAYQESNPTNMVRVGARTFDGGGQMAKSSDNGRTWKRIPFSESLVTLHCAVSATNADNIVVICGASANSAPVFHGWKPIPATDPWQHSTDGGATWTVIKGLPAPPGNSGMFAGPAPLVSDTVNGNAFYYSGQDGKIYRSTDGGANFSWINGASGQLLPPKSSRQLKVRPGVEGDLWASVDNDSGDIENGRRAADEGLYHSADGGVTWAKVETVSRAWLFCFGKAPSGGSVPALYLYGRVKGDTTDGIHRSLDLGKTWIDITDPKNLIGDCPDVMEASRQNFGVVFIGTSGRGIFYGAPRAK